MYAPQPLCHQITALAFWCIAWIRCRTHSAFSSFICAVPRRVSDQELNNIGVNFLRTQLDAAEQCRRYVALRYFDT
jgi:hypothetical protein